MLFNSYSFLFVFLPIALVIFHFLRSQGMSRVSFLSLVILSLVFYGYWNPVYLTLLIPQMLFNFAVATAIFERRIAQPSLAKILLIVGITVNLSLLGYFKYANFFVDNLNELTGVDIIIATIVLPLGISFITFQKIAFLVDTYQGKLQQINLLDFSLFVTFFPQLIAGPIVHHSEMMPQFYSKGKILDTTLAMGVTIFAIGLAKKVLLADTAALYASPLFDSAANGTTLDMLSAWTAALAYTVQLYFDFSAYSDMAIGIALMFGIHLPMNFASPYKATSIVDFWRRWHMTLSRFLRDYLYIPLGGNRNGKARRLLNLMVTMLLGGLWHGAGWTFVVWGALHGIYLVINHSWHQIRSKLPFMPKSVGFLEIRLGHLITFLAVVVAWVFFRAADIGTALSILHSMAGMNEITAESYLVPLDMAIPVIFGLLFLAWFAPNTQQIVGYTGPDKLDAGEFEPEPPKQVIAWKPAPQWVLAVGALAGLSVMSLSKVSEFLYFQF
ncbi:MBOAT family O-acyltransferase [Thiomicrorhabdus xiamenensis]|uniref:Probable alginate O-acetylase n=1 Tax=Thiomicrorhabdus xiamenensis TaxID=2739063 RepID=A0A7D4P4I3_9GAMM|nr:MBOAT family protein [Thiomicrorhabdus xiamenensis]QKI88895.1 MBOAT family protein [Thiomicrorhabdus xiamenensis]